ncbi:MAG: gas vesicle protein GvpD basic region 2 domain-containing protein [Thermoplasmatota archaeon]
MAADTVEHIPPEIMKFFRENVGEILLVKGPPGSGKTLFSLECLKALCRNQTGVAIFTRLDSDQLSAEMPWLLDMDRKHNLLAYHQNDKIADPNWFKREFEALRSKNKEKTIGYMLLDTIDAITEQYENPERKMKEIVSLVQSTNVSAIMVQEEEGVTYLDHLAGGVVRIHFNKMEGRRYRAISIEKLRGVEVGRTEYLMSLHQGIFQAFRPWAMHDVKEGEWKNVPDSETHFSSGLVDLDRILGGGYKRGSYNILDIDDNISSFEYLLLTRPILLNFLNQKFGVVMVPPAGEHPESIRDDLMRYVDEDTVSEYLYFLDYFSTSTKKPYIISMGGSSRKDGGQQRGMEVIQHLRGRYNKPYIDFVGLDTMEYLMGESITLRHLLTGVSKTKVTKTLGIGLAKPGLKIGQGIRNMADVYLRLVKINSIPCFYGIKPQTGIYAMMPDQERGFPNLRLVPLT